MIYKACKRKKKEKKGFPSAQLVEWILKWLKNFIYTKQNHNESNFNDKEIHCLVKC